MKTNLMDVLLLLLKASVLERGRKMRLSKDSVLRAENADLKMERSNITGEILLELVEGQDPSSSKIILPHGQSPLTIVN
jgi:hypothetical protein